MVQQLGPGAGAKKMLTWEFAHAREAEESGVYITWRSEQAKDDCFRVGSNSKCFCGHLHSSHEKKLTAKKQVTNCTKCECKGFAFIPRRPEEVGQWWLPRRKGFNINTWRPSCTCKHTHEEHKPNRPTKCTKCSCFGFTSDFCCLGCDQKFEEHETIYETEKERQQLGKPIREAYYPLASTPEIQKETMKKLGLDGRSYEEKLIEELKQEEEEKQGAYQVANRVSSQGIPLKPGQTEVFINSHPNGPQVSMIVDKNQNYAPKQDLSKPEKSIRLMQERGIAG